MKYFDADFFKNNRRELQKLHPDELIIVTANGLVQRNSDMALPFRQDSNFWYLTGIEEPDAILVIDGKSEYLIVPERDEIRQAFDGFVDAGDLTQISAIKSVYNSEKGWKKLGSQLKKAKQVSSVKPLPEFVDHYAFYANPARAKLYEKLLAAEPSLEINDMRESLVSLRAIKQAPELQAITDSVNLTVATLTDLKQHLSSFKYEYEVEAFISHAFRRNNARHGYSPIIAAGRNACTLHYEANSDAISRDELLLIDVGAELEYYSADITRTVAYGKPSVRQQQITDAVIEVQDYALSLLKPGTKIKENEKKIETFMGEKLMRLGLIAENTKENVRRFYPHATSHFLGLDVHDVGDYEAPLLPGMVLTVEPGIYVPEENIGVRIEDNIVITDEGYSNISKNLPRDLR